MTADQANSRVRTHWQHPLGTPFGPAATAADALAGIDLTGVHAIVTGGHAGIGREVTRVAR